MNYLKCADQNGKIFKLKTSYYAIFEKGKTNKFLITNVSPQTRS